MCHVLLSVPLTHMRFFYLDDEANSKMGIVLHHVYHELLTLWIQCLEHFTCSLALKTKGQKPGNHSPSRTRVLCLLAQALGPFTAQLWESTLLLSFTISSSPESLPSGPKTYMSSAVKTYVNWACWALEKTLHLTGCMGLSGSVLAGKQYGQIFAAKCVGWT